MMVLRRGVLLSVLGVAACARAEFDAYEGQDAIRTGRGGTRRGVEGIDLWTNGAPPRRYQVLGVLRVQAADGPIGQSAANTRFASEVRERGGNAAILLDSGSQIVGASRVGPNTFVNRDTIDRYLVIRYLPD